MQYLPRATDVYKLYEILQMFGKIVPRLTLVIANINIPSQFMVIYEYGKCACPTP